MPSQPHPRPENQPPAESGPDPEPATRPEPPSESGPKPQPKPTSKSGTEPEAKTRTGSKPKPKPESGSEPGSEPGSGSGSEPGSGSGATSRPRSAAKRRPTSRKGLSIGALVVVGALLAGWLSQYAVGGDSGGSASGNATVQGRPDDGPAGDPALLKLARRDAHDPFARGAENAPVVMIEYADFGCSFCGKFARDTEPKLVKKYVDKGLLRLEWRNFPVFGKGSERAALASYAAGQQGRFWQFYKAVYSDKGNEKNAFGDAHLHDLAEEAGVRDLDRFDRDRAGAAAKKLLAKDREEAYGLGASATPAFLVNGEPIAGAQPDEVFTDTIERAAAAAKKDGRSSEKSGAKSDEGAGANEGAGENASEGKGDEAGGRG